MSNKKPFLTLSDYTTRIHKGDSVIIQNIYEDNYDIDLSAAIIHARKNAQMSQKELAIELGTQQPNVARFESGNHLPTHEMIKKIARVLKLRPIAPSLKKNLSEGVTQLFITMNVWNTIPSIPYTHTESRSQYAKK